MPEDPIDPKRANIAMGLAVTRWRKLPDDSVADKLDDAQEWVQEAALMNHFLPVHLGPRGYSFIVVTPNEFSVGIKNVRQYAGLIYKHMVPITVPLDVHVVAETREFLDAGRSHKNLTPSELIEGAGDFITTTSPLRLFGVE